MQEIPTRLARPAICLGLAIGVAVALAGCNPELDTYRLIELGQPLPQNEFLIQTEEAPSETVQPIAHGDAFLFPLPSIAAGKAMGVLLDAGGDVAAKFYSDMLLEHWLVLQIGASRWYLTVDVPADRFHEVPEGWEDVTPKLDALVAMRFAGQDLGEGLPDLCRTTSSVIDHTLDEYVDTINMVINPQRLRPGVIERVTVDNPSPLVELEADVDMSGIDVAAFRATGAEFHLVKGQEGLYLRAVCRAPRNANHVVGYIDHVVRQIRQALPGRESSYHLPMLAENMGLVMYVGGRTAWPDCLLYEHEDLQGITQRGFERHIDFQDGGKAHIRNLGDRRVQVEFEFFRIIDPLFIIPMIELSSGSSAGPVLRSGGSVVGQVTEE